MLDQHLSLPYPGANLGKPSFGQLVHTKDIFQQICSY